MPTHPSVLSFKTPLPDGHPDLVGLGQVLCAPTSPGHPPAHVLPLPLQCLAWGLSGWQVYSKITFVE